MKKKARILAAVIAVALLITAGAMAIQDYVDRKFAGGAEATEAVTGADLLAMAAIENELTIDPINFRDLMDPAFRAKLEGFGRKFSNESMPGVPRLFSDSVAKPVELPTLQPLMMEFATANDARRKEIEKEIVQAAKGLEGPIMDVMMCQGIVNPNVTEMVIDGLAPLRPAGEGGNRCDDLNSWMPKYKAIMDNGGIANFLVKKGDVIEVTDFQLETGWMVAMLLSRFKIIDVNKYETSEHFGLVAAADPMMQRTERVFYKEDLPALKLAIVLKDSNTTATVAIGFNLMDKRLEILPVLGQKESKPEVKERVKVIRDTKVIEKTKVRTEYRDRIQYRDRWKVEYKYIDRPVPVPPVPPVPPAPVPPAPPVKPDGEGGKDPKQDPAEQGNAPIGGLPNMPGDGAGDYQPTPPVRPPSNEDPIPIVPEKPLPDPAPAPTPTPTPPPSPEPGDSLEPTPTPPVTPTPPEKPEDPPFDGDEIIP